jgi:hypothetical protein
MQDKLSYLVEGMLVFTTIACAILAAYVMMTLSNMPY